LLPIQITAKEFFLDGTRSTLVPRFEGWPLNTVIEWDW